MKEKKDIGGWQTMVHLEGNYAIKIPRTYKELRKKSYPLLKKVKKKDEEGISKVARWSHSNVKKSKEIISGSGIPMVYLGSPIFYKSGKVKQKRVVELGKKIDNLIKKGDMVRARKVIDKYFDFVKLLWEYGMHEVSFKLHNNFGMTRGGRMVLIDLFELSDNYESIVKKMRKKSKRKDYWIVQRVRSPKLISYYRKKANETFNKKTLDKHWMKRITNH